MQIESYSTHFFGERGCLASFTQHIVSKVHERTTKAWFWNFHPCIQGLSFLFHCMAGCPEICLPIRLAVDTVAAFRVSAPLIQTARPSTFGSVSEPAFLFHWSTCLSLHTQCQTVLITVVYSQSWKQAGRSFNFSPSFPLCSGLAFPKPLFHGTWIPLKR